MNPLLQYPSRISDIRKRVGSFRTLIFILLILLANDPLPVISAEKVSIKTLLSNPESYALRVITIDGTIRHLVFIRDFPVRGCLIPGAYRISIEDDTGSLEVVVCQQPLEAMGIANAGDRVELDVSIFPVKSGSSPLSIEAIAKGIRRINNK